MGVFGGKYMTDCCDEFPAHWFSHAKLCPEHTEPSLNFFGVNASSLFQYGVIRLDPPRRSPRLVSGWYCRYYSGRRHLDDERQIARWKAVRRHIALAQETLALRDLNCRRKQRQALLHWAYDSRNI